MSEGFRMKGKFQSSVSIVIQAPASKIWEIADDISLIPSYHPEVGKVDLIDGKSKRVSGVKYQCSVLEGRRGSCIEEVVEYIPQRKISTAMSQDTWGIDKMLADFIVDSIVRPIDEHSCSIQFDAYYNPFGFRKKVLNILVLRRAFKKRSPSVMQGIKHLAETGK